MTMTITRQALLAGPGLITSIGAPGAGKTTFFDSLDAPNHLRLERDKFRDALFGGRREYWNNPMDEGIKATVVRQAMRGALRGWPMPQYLLSDTGAMQNSVSYFIHAADERYRGWVNRRRSSPLSGVPVTLIVFEEPLGVLLDRNDTRPVEHQVPGDILTERYDAIYGRDAWWRRFDTGKPKGRVRVLRPHQITN